MENLEVELARIRERNQRVEADKAWETSLFRKLLIAGITYVVAAVALYVIRAENPLAGAIIPTLGFLLSTLTVSGAKGWWIAKCFAPRDKRSIL